MQIQNKIPVVNSHDSWSKLEEVWLGDVYPGTWYDHLDPQVRDVFHQLTEITQADLNKIQHTLEGLGIVVRRPCYDRIDDFLDHRGMLVKPQICPRDHFLVIGNQLIGHRYQLTAWQNTIDRYSTDARCGFTISDDPCVNGANVVRMGRDIIIDAEDISRDYQAEWPRYRVRTVNNGGHLDACFAILKPGLILANHYYDDYENTFPGWEIITLDRPDFQASVKSINQQPHPVCNGKFWDTTIGTNASFNQHVVDHALDWVGCYIETYFELNCLVIDTANVVMLGHNPGLAQTLFNHGITVHWVPFRARSFWDGAMHCLTVDIRRDSEIVDYFS